MNQLQVMDIQRKTRLHSMSGCVSMRPMRCYLNSWGGFVAVAIIAAMPLCTTQAADLKHARVWAGPEYTRVVLDASGRSLGAARAAGLGVAARARGRGLDARAARRAVARRRFRAACAGAAGRAASSSRG